MKKLKQFGLLLTVVAMISSCSIITPAGVGATSNPVGSKVGKAKATIYLGVLCFNQDASVLKAAKNGGITKISTVDVKHFDVLHLYDTYETIVTGE